MWLYSDIRTLGDIPRYHGATTPDAVALMDGDGNTESFAQLDEMSNRVAQLLLGDFGVIAGDRVAVLGHNSMTIIGLLFGISKAGATLLPLNWRLAAPELKGVLEDATPRVILADKEFVELATTLVEGTDCRVISYDAAEPANGELERLCLAASPADPRMAVDPWQSALLIYTSGTTGTPKGVQLSHQGYLYLQLCCHLHPALDFNANDMMLVVLPFFHAMGLGLSLQMLYLGGAVLVSPMPDPGGLIELIAHRKPTLLPLVPTVIHMMLDHPSSNKDAYTSVRRVIYAGAAITTELLRRAIAEMGCGLMNLYGATETSSAITMLPPEDLLSGDESKLKSCGKPLPLVEIKIADERGVEVPSGIVGEFLIRSPSLCTGYFNQPAATEAAFTGGWYHSGDAGYSDEDGYLYLVDRIKDMIITGGENVYSLEVENALHELSGVALCAVVGVPDDKWGERVTAFVVADPGVDLSERAVTDHCRKLIAGYKVPKEVRFVAELPTTPTGKILKRQLVLAAQAAQ
jgi:acyl-CoA synthetase (AMP-forming)/AMP-acid ligase II